MRAVEALLRTGRALLTQHAPGAPQKFGFHYPPFNRCGRPRRCSPAPARRTGLTLPSLRPPLQMYSCVPSSDTCEHFQASDEREQDIGLGQWW